MGNMKIISTFLLTAMVTIAMEKCTARYLLVEIDDAPTPRECCEDSSVPEFCLGLCSPSDASARQENRITACSKYDAIIEKCFQSADAEFLNEVNPVAPVDASPASRDYPVCCQCHTPRHRCMIGCCPKQRK